MRLEQGVFLVSLAGYGNSLTDELEAFLKSATARARAPSRTKLPFSQVRSMTRIIMTRIILGAIVFTFGAAMTAQGQSFPPPSFDSEKDATPLSHKQMGTTPKQEVPPGANPRAAPSASFATTADSA